jgi:hypothetical protein
VARIFGSWHKRHIVTWLHSLAKLDGSGLMPVNGKSVGMVTTLADSLLLSARKMEFLPLKTHRSSVASCGASGAPWSSAWKR